MRQMLPKVEVNTSIERVCLIFGRQNFRGRVEQHKICLKFMQAICFHSILEKH